MFPPWFYDLPCAPPKSYFDDLVCQLDGVSILSRETNSWGTSGGSETVLVGKGKDRFRIVVGHEYEVDIDGNESLVWWVLGESSPWWRRLWNPLPELIVPHLEALSRQ